MLNNYLMRNILEIRIKVFDKNMIDTVKIKN